MLHLHFIYTFLPSPSNFSQLFAHSSTPFVDVGYGGHISLFSTFLYTVHPCSNRITICCKRVCYNRGRIQSHYWTIPCNYLWYISMACSFNKVAQEQFGGDLVKEAVDVLERWTATCIEIDIPNRAIIICVSPSSYHRLLLRFIISCVAEPQLLWILSNLR